MARLKTLGHELNTDLAIEWDGRYGVQTFSTTTVRSGTYSLQLSGLVTLTTKGLRYNFKSSANNGPFFFRNYIYFVSFPLIEDRIIVFNNTGDLTTPIVYLTIDNSGVLRLYDEDGQITGTSTLSTATWYRIETEIDVTAAAGSHVVKSRVASPSQETADTYTEFASATNRSLSAGVMSMSIGANLASEANATGEWYFDDHAINDNTTSNQNSYPDEGEVIVRRPNGNGDNSQWTGSDGNSTDNYLLVDEVTPNDATDYVESKTSGQIDDYTVEDMPASMDSNDVINVVHVEARFIMSSASGTDPTAVLRVKASSGGTVEESATISFNSIADWWTNSQAEPHNAILTLYDQPGASTSPWTKATLDTAQIGIRETNTDADLFRVTAIWMTVDHKPSPPKSLVYNPRRRAMQGILPR